MQPGMGMHCWQTVLHSLMNLLQSLCLRMSRYSPVNLLCMDCKAANDSSHCKDIESSVI